LNVSVVAGDITAKPVHFESQETTIVPTVPKEELSQYIDKPLEPSEWVLIDQDRIDSFADATLDHQFIHVDKEKAAQTAFGGTIAHGYLTMSLISHFLPECAVQPADAVMGINYGSDKVRFLQPVPVDSEVRGSATLKEVTEKSPGQLLLKNEFVVQIKGEEKPALVAEILSLFIVQ
jgi:acyl dehydratase